MISSKWYDRNFAHVTTAQQNSDLTKWLKIITTTNRIFNYELINHLNSGSQESIDLTHIYITDTSAIIQ